MMDDLISRQAAIDAINKAFERVFAWDGTSPLGDKVLENVPSVQLEPQWIPVKREVPEKPGYYITSSEYGGVTVDFYYNYFWNAQKNAYKVLAWMPLPKIYKPNNE